MNILSPCTVLAAAVISAPAWRDALVRHDLSVSDAATRTLITLVVCAFAVGAVERLVHAYASGRGKPPPPSRRADDEPEHRGRPAR